MSTKKPSNIESLGAILNSLSGAVQWGKYNETDLNNSRISASLLLADVVSELQTLNRTFESIRGSDSNNNDSEGE